MIWMFIVGYKTIFFARAWNSFRYFYFIPKIQIGYILCVKALNYFSSDAPFFEFTQTLNNK